MPAKHFSRLKFVLYWSTMAISLLVKRGGSMRSDTVEYVTSDLSEKLFNHKSVKRCTGTGPLCLARFNHFSLTVTVL